MRIKMLAVAIAAGITLASVGAQAQSTGSDSQELAQLREQLASLQAQVTELERRQQEEQATAPKAAAPVAAWAEKTTIGGRMYFDLTNSDETENGSTTDASVIGLDVTRFYLTVDHRFDDVWSANLTTDFNYVRNDGETQLFVKKAYVEGAFSKLVTMRVGSAGMPWIPFVEDWYGYRFVEKVLMDRTKFGNSADWGVHLLGGNSVFDYQVSAVNGGGYKDPTRSSHVDFAARVGVQPIEGLTFAAGGYEGDLGEDTETSPAINSARRYDLMAAWNRDGLRLGAEWFRADNWHTVTLPLDDAADGWSLWGSYDFARASVFARYDSVEPSKDIDPGLRNTYWHAGVAFSVTKGVKLALAYKDERLRNDTDIDVKAREFGVWGEVKF